MFYAGIYARVFLLEDPEDMEDRIRIAFVKFEKPLKVVDYKMGAKMQKAKRKARPKKPVPKPKPKPKPKIVKPTPVKKPPVSTPKTSSQPVSKATQVARGRKTSVPKSGSVRPGGSFKTPSKQPPRCGTKNSGARP